MIVNYLAGMGRALCGDMSTTKKWQKRYDAQQRAIDVPLTTGQRFTRTIAAIMAGADDVSAIEAKWLLRAARREQLLKR